MDDQPHSANSRSTCPSCNSETAGLFCSLCGEKRVTDQDYSLQRYGGEILAAATLLESKVFRSVWLVLIKPGFLSSEYFRGRRVRYMKPLQLFVFLNILYYFSITLFYATTFTTPLATQLHMNNYYPNTPAHELRRNCTRRTLTTRHWKSNTMRGPEYSRKH